MSYSERKGELEQLDIACRAVAVSLGVLRVAQNGLAILLNEQSAVVAFTSQRNADLKGVWVVLLLEQLIATLSGLGALDGVDVCKLGLLFNGLFNLKALGQTRLFAHQSKTDLLLVLGYFRHTVLCERLVEVLKRIVQLLNGDL